MTGWVRWIRMGAVMLPALGKIVLLLAWLAGAFHEKIDPGPSQVGLRP